MSAPVRMPALFLSHGSPMTAIQSTAAAQFLKSYAAEMPTPRAILIATAHFETDFPALTSDAKPEMIYDFRGFPRQLYEMRYDAPGDPDLAMRAARLAHDAGFKVGLAQHRGYDHGTWVPLKLMYPQADVPVVQISVQPHHDARHHISLGRALAPLRDEGVLVVGSGSLTHNLYELSRGGRQLDAQTRDWVETFAEWVAQKVEAGDDDAIAQWETAPFAHENHPSPEHFLPLPFAVGAGAGAKGRRVHKSVEYGVLSMDAYRFD